MLRKLRPRSIYDVFAVLAFMVAVSTGGAYAADTVFSSDIADGEVKSVDIGNSEVNSADVKDQSLTTFDVSTFLGADVVDETLTGADIGDGSLNDEDVGQGAFVHFTASIGLVPANGCLFKDITGVGAKGDHMLLTPDWDDTDSLLIYNVQYRAASDTAVLNVCNPTNTDIVDNTAHFNLLVFDAQ